MPIRHDQDILRPIHREEDARRLLETSFDGIWAIDSDLRTTFVNARMAGMLGYSPQEMQGRRLFDFLFPEDVPAEEVAIGRRKRGVREEFELRYRRKDGSELWARVATAPILAEDGTFQGAVAIHSDISRRRWMEQLLEERERELRQAERLAHIGTWQWLPETDSASWSEGLYRIAGRDPSSPAVSNKEQAELYTAESWSRLNAAVQEALAHATPYELDLELVRPDGGTRWVVVRGEALRDQNGCVGKLRGTVQDITERKLAEQETQKLAAIVESSDDAIISKDLNGIITSWNPAATRMFGYTAEEVIDRSILMLIPSELHAEEDGILARLRAGERIDHYETERVAKDGRRLQISVTISPIKDATGRVIGASKVARDVTERKRGEGASSHLAAIVESSDDAIISKNLQGIITSWNAAATRLFGYAPEEAIGQSILMLIPPELHADEDEILGRLRAGQRVEHFQTQRVKKNGERIDVSLTISPVRDSTGRIIGASKIARDISERKRAEQALLTSEKLATVGRLAATVAHEINNPLESVINLVYLAKGTATEAAVQAYLTAAEEELNRISHLSKQTLSFYRQRSEKTRAHAGELLRELVAVFSSRAQNRSLRVDLEIVNDAEILVDVTEFRQLFANLISNSIDACGPGGIIRVRASTSAYGLRVTVADNGSGIRPADRPHVFEAFFTTKKNVGTGLGLWVCKQVAEKYGGSIHVRSDVRPGRSWAAVSVLLPVTVSGSRPLVDHSSKRSLKEVA